MMKKQHNDMLRLFRENTSTLDWIKAQKQLTTGLEHDRLVLLEHDLIHYRLRMIAKIPIELLTSFYNQTKSTSNEQAA